MRLGFHFFRIRLIVEFKLLVLFFLLTEKPLLTPFEAETALGDLAGWWRTVWSEK